MEDKRLKRVFDQVRLSPEREEAILEELLEDRRAERRGGRYRAAALAAAVLAVVLAGTALALEYFGKVELELTDNFRGRKGYAVYMPEERVPADSLPAELLAACPEENFNGYVQLPFASWEEAEAYTGLELADNAVLEQMPKTKLKYQPEDKKQVPYTHCLLSVWYSGGVPDGLSLGTSYDKGNCHISEHIELYTDNLPEPMDRDRSAMSAAVRRDAEFETYVTPSGMEVTIYSERIPDGGGRETTLYRAYFIKNSALFSLQLTSSEAWRIGREGREFLDPWETLTEILDAYE